MDVYSRALGCGHGCPRTMDMDVHLTRELTHQSWGGARSAPYQQDLPPQKKQEVLRRPKPVGFAGLGQALAPARLSGLKIPQGTAARRRARARREPSPRSRPYP